MGHPPREIVDEQDERHPGHQDAGQGLLAVEQGQDCKTGAEGDQPGRKCRHHDFAASALNTTRPVRPTAQSLPVVSSAGIETVTR
ncbi:hypothetical protein ACVIST_000346 [Bradyrhizobium elkanii]